MESNEALTIRTATLDDLDALVAGNAALAWETEGLRLSLDVLRAGVGALLRGEVPGRYVVVVNRSGAVLAQLMITYEWSDWRNAMVWWIQSVYVLPEGRRRGLYRRLYEHVQQAARAEGVAGLRLYVYRGNTQAQATYAALGMDGEHYRMFEAMFA